MNKYVDYMTIPRPWCSTVCRTEAHQSLLCHMLLNYCCGHQLKFRSSERVSSGLLQVVIKHVQQVILLTLSAWFNKLTLWGCCEDLIWLKISLMPNHLLQHHHHHVWSKFRFPFVFLTFLYIKVFIYRLMHKRVALRQY